MYYSAANFSCAMGYSHCKQASSRDLDV